MHTKSRTNDRPVAIDRRVARTRALLKQALVELIPERGFAAITVEEICARANVGRSTFYTHYEDKEALRQATMEDHLQKIGRARGSQHEGDQAFAFSLPMFEHALEFGPLHRALIADRRDAIHDQLRDKVRKAVRCELAGRTPDGIPDQIAVEFLTGAFLALLGWWVESGYPLQPVELDDHFQKLATAGLPLTGSEQATSQAHA
ncbi:TetR/AcrR family transcriptional regulator [Chelativorans xinjiangense]|uniref:TetR/AcrR family transcriptional regulator n=1 Tax=Chelativorans xinjiangense TaxID=2681485 RepID=UPI0031B5EADF